MKYIKYTAVFMAVVVLSGCSSYTVREVDAPVVSLQEATDDGVEPIPEESAEQTTITLPEETEPAPAETTVSAEPETEQAVIPEEDIPTAELPAEETEESYIFTEDGEVLDTFYIDDYGAYDIPARDREFTKQSIFVGDSICKGFSEYKVVGKKRVYARGNLGARSFFDYAFYYGDEDEEIDYSELLRRTQPKYVFLSMGMNDVNMTDEDMFCENYSRIIDKTLAESGAQVYVCAITPINSEFTTNYRIDCFNIRLKKYIEDNYPERVSFVDFGMHLRDEDGNLRENLTSGDGIHLAPYAYYIALWEFNRNLKADTH